MSTLFMIFPVSRGQEKVSFAREDRGRSTLAPGWPHPTLETQFSLCPRLSFSVQRTCNSPSSCLPEPHFQRQHFGYSPGVPLCASSPKHHTASSTNNLDIPDVTVLVFRHKPPHFASAQRGQATCPRSHSKAGEQLGSLTTNPECFWGTLDCG